MTEEEVMRIIDECIAEFQASIHKKAKIWCTRKKQTNR